MRTSSPSAHVQKEARHSKQVHTKEGGFLGGAGVALGASCTSLTCKDSPSGMLMSFFHSLLPLGLKQLQFSVPNTRDSLN